MLSTSLRCSRKQSLLEALQHFGSGTRHWVPLGHRTAMLGSLQADEETQSKPEPDVLCNWKTLCLHVDESELIVICQIKSSTTVLISAVSFHNYIRRASKKGTVLSKWLLHDNGHTRIHHMAIKLCPSLACLWAPNEKMQTANSNANSTTSATSACTEVLVTPAWLLVYTLLVNCNHKRSPNQSGPDEMRQKQHSFHVLNTLVTNACEATIGQFSHMDIKTAHITLHCTSHGQIQEIMHDERFTTLKAMLQCCQLTEHIRTPHGLVRVESLAGMLWHLASICMKSISPSDSKLYDIAHDLCHQIMIFLASGLQLWFQQAKEADVHVQ